MFALCDTMRPLSECFYCRASYVESLLLFNSKFPNARSVIVFRDLRGRGDPNDLQYIATLSAKNIQSLKAKYLPK